MPYRIDVAGPPAHALDTLVELGALDVEPVEGGIAALMPDAVPAATIAHALGISSLRVSPATGRDDDSVWTLSLRPVRTRTLEIVPATMPAPPGALRITDTPAFGTGLHPTTALCLEAIEDLLDAGSPARVLDVGTGSGILALAALRLGVAHAVGLDIDRIALAAAAENARLNHVRDRLAFVCGDIEAVRGSWPLVLANIRAAELMEMASALGRRVASGGHLVLSGVPRAVAPDVEQAYRRLGMAHVASSERGGWTALVLRPSW